MNHATEITTFRDGGEIVTITCTREPAPESAPGDPMGVWEGRITLLRELADAIGEKTLIRLAQHLTTARRKHPKFAENHAEAMCAVQSEFYEWLSQALLVRRMDGSVREQRRDRAEKEILDLIATGIRYLGREYEGAQP